MAPMRVVIAKLGLDGHDRGAKIIARVLRDAGLVRAKAPDLANSPEQNYLGIPT